MNSNYVELYQFFSMTNFLKQAERDSHTNNTPTIILHNVYFILANLFTYRDFYFFSSVVTKNFKKRTKSFKKRTFKEIT